MPVKNALYLIKPNFKNSMRNKLYAQSLNWIDNMHNFKQFQPFLSKNINFAQNESILKFQ